MIDVRLPRRVDANGNTVEEYHPISMSLDLNIKPLSTATMQLPWDENIPARSFVELFTPLGSAGFFRVRSPEDAYGEDMTSVELEHAITEVGDYLVKAKYDEMMAANTAMQTVFSHYGGGRWQLGSVAALGSGQIALSANYDRVLDAMLAILEQKPECYLAFNFSTTPWTVSIATKDTTVSAEGRLSRNVDSAKIIYDDTELCTRVYYEHETTTDSTAGINLNGVPTFDVNTNYSAGTIVLYSNKLYSLPNGHTAGETWANTTSVLQNNIPTSEWAYLDADTIGTYGLIERRVSTGSDYTEGEAQKVAQEYLRTHKKPKVTVRVQAEELANTTGEPWDTFTIGKLLRLALVDYNVTVCENITGQSWNDVYNEPESMEVVLGDEEDTAIKFLHDVDSKGGSGGGGGGGRKQDDQWKEYRTIFEQDDYHFGLYAQRLNTAEEILQQAGLYIDANGVLIFAEDNENMLGSKLKVEAGRITAIATRMANAEDILSQAGLEIDATTGVLIYHTDNANMLGAKMAVQAGKIEMVVGTTDQGGNYIKAASITLAINNAGSSAMINADKIYLLGETIANTITADYINGKIATIPTLTGIAASFSGNVSCSGLFAGQVYVGSGGSYRNLSNPVQYVQLTGPENNVYTLRVTKLDGTYKNYTFSRAIASASWEWSGSAVKVTLSPQGQAFTSNISVDNWSGTGSVSYNTSNKKVSQNIQILDNTGDVITTYSVSIDATKAYNAGKSDGEGTATANYNRGWNDCIDTIKNGYGHTVLTGYSTYNNGSSTSLYVAPTGGASIATGAARVWRYGGSTATRYTLPDKK